MASSQLTMLNTNTLLLLLLSSLTVLTLSNDEESFGRPLDAELLGLKERKLTHFRVYWHDIYSGKKPTAMPIVQPPKNSSTLFGAVSIIDDALTLEPKLSSKLMGRAQGFYGSTSEEDFVFLMAMNFVFIEGKYNGSTITIMGRNQVFSQVREMPIIGGSGLFRFATGYVHASTHTLDLKTGDACVEYNVYVLHY